MRRLAIWLLLVSPCLAQEPRQNHLQLSEPVVHCPSASQANKGNLDVNKDAVDLQTAIALVTDAINEAKCKNYDPDGRFQLTTADIQFQTLVDTNGSLEILFIGGITGELDKQVTSLSDFTYSVPTPLDAVPVDHSKLRAEVLGAKPKVTPAKNLGDAIAAAMQQMEAGLGDFPELSQHQVKVSIAFAVTKQGGLELEPKIGSVGITAKLTRTNTATQTLTLTFADQAPTVNLTVTPSSPITGGSSVTMIATIVPPSNSSRVPKGEVTFLDGAIVLGTRRLVNGYAGITVPSLSPGAHSLTAVYGSDRIYDSAVSSASVMLVEPNILPN
jgi:hypothetical protein